LILGRGREGKGKQKGGVERVGDKSRRGKERRREDFWAVVIFFLGETLLGGGPDIGVGPL